jgi:hypothetical protein
MVRGHAGEVMTIVQMLDLSHSYLLLYLDSNNKESDSAPKNLCSLLLVLCVSVVNFKSQFFECFIAHTHIERARMPVPQDGWMLT